MSQVPMITPLGCSLMEVHRFEKKLKKVEEKKVEKKVKKVLKKGKQVDHQISLHKVPCKQWLLFIIFLINVYRSSINDHLW